ncbi:MAG TPA: BatD family protein [Bacteroidota bacterium]|nr:BatD family protein [Bacteroidota bacterium]
MKTKYLDGWTAGLRRAAAVCVTLVAVAAAALGQSFTASVDRNPAATNEPFSLDFTMNGGGAGGGKNLKLPDLSKFMILSGPNQSTSMQIINGNVSSSVTYSYVLQAREPGKFTIGSATIEAGGKTLTSSPIELTVVKGSGASRQSAQQQQGGESDVKIGDNIFVRAIVDRSKVMQGEQITVSYKIYTRVNIINYAINKLPTMTGFWGEDLTTPQQIQLTNETINGKQYRVGLLKKTALFPTQSGTLEINPLEITCQVQVQSRRRSGDIFDDFFNDPFMGNARTQNVNIKTEPTKITVLPLPKTDVPSSFKGAVGHFSLSSNVAKHAVKTNEPLSLKATISGTGNIKILEAPELQLPADFEKYDPKVSESIDRSGGAISGSKTFEWLIVPRYPGAKKIPSLEFSYFDPAKGKYVTARTDEISLEVEKGSAEAPSAASGLSKEDVKILNEDIRFIKPSSGNFHRRGDTGIAATEAAAFVMLPLAAFIGLVVYRRKSIRESADVITFRSRRAMKIAAKRLKAAHVLLSGSDPDAFYTEISRALWTYVADKLGIDRSELSIDNVTDTLEGRKLNPELIGRIKECLESCEFARFAPASALQVEKQKMYDSAGSIIVEMEHQLKQR